MRSPIKSIRPFIGARDFTLSRKFYLQLGFTEVRIDGKMSLFSLENFGFYLQNAYVKDWVDNTMLFLEVTDAQDWLTKVSALGLPAAFPGVRLSAMVENDWGREFFLHDPAGILWHIGEFNTADDQFQAAL